MAFQIRALEREPFAHLFDASDEALAAHRAVRVVADKTPGYPDRISLRDAEPGDVLLLVNHEHQGADSPYRSRHAVYVSRDAVPALLAPDELPPYFTGRTISLRAFDPDGMIVGAELVEGEDAAAAINSLLTDAKAEYFHAHFAKYGCYACRIDRA